MNGYTTAEIEAIEQSIVESRSTENGRWVDMCKCALRVRGGS